MIKKLAALAVASALLSLAGCVTAPSTPDYIAAAVANPARPEADRKRDEDRKPAEMLQFAEVKLGQKVADLIPGRFYFSRLFSMAVGDQGRVYAYIASELDPFYKKNNIAVPTSIEGFPNVLIVHQPIGILTLPEQVDLVWTSQNYHDMKDKFMGPVDMARYNKAVFDALKPGGLYIVLDHSAASNAPADVTETLHRIEESVVKAEVLAAGFELVGESNVLRNPNDPRDKNVFDASIRAHTDQFILKFRKPR